MSCKRKSVPIGIMWWWSPLPETNLSIAITWPDEFTENLNTVYTAELTFTGIIGSPTTVLTVTLPAWITYVSSSDGWTHNAGVITWTLWDIPASAKNITFTVTSETVWTWYEITGGLTSWYVNNGTTTANKFVDVIEWWQPIEWRVNWIPSDQNITEITKLEGFHQEFVDFLPIFTFDPEYISGDIRKIGTTTWTPTWNFFWEIQWTADSPFGNFEATRSIDESTTVVTLNVFLFW